MSIRNMYNDLKAVLANFFTANISARGNIFCNNNFRFLNIRVLNMLYITTCITIVVAIIFFVVGGAVNLHIDTRRRVANLSIARRNLLATCTKFTVLPSAAATLSTRCRILNSIPMSSTIPIQGMAVRSKIRPGFAGVRVVYGRSHLRGLGGTVVNVNVANVAISRILKYNVRANGPRCCHNMPIRPALLPGIRVSVIIDGIPIHAMVRATGGILCAKRVNSNGVFICSMRGIMGIHANRRKCSTLRSIRWRVVACKEATVQFSRKLIRKKGGGIFRC